MFVYSSFNLPRPKNLLTRLSSNHYCKQCNVILTNISLAMKLFKSHHNSLKHALPRFISSTVKIFFNSVTLPLQKVTITQNAFLSIKCTVVLLTLAAATWKLILYLVTFKYKSWGCNKHLFQPFPQLMISYHVRSKLAYLWLQQ